MKFSWHERKATRNLSKHGISFQEGAMVFRDQLAVTGYDPDHSEGEDRYVTFGMSTKNRLLVVSHADDGDTIRIISCRPATKPERMIYEEG
ncbi:MAG: BrnT family toxin [Gammaproteobacteria bacterium]|nr:BrnT family toxin [Gammaproteobacteria bacterium]